MYKLVIDNKKELKAELLKDGLVSLNGRRMITDQIEVKEGTFNVILENRSFNAVVLSHDRESKTFTIRVNNNTYRIAVMDQYDVLLQQLGFDNNQAHKAADLKAPMPGLVVEVSVNEGQEVKKGDKILVLEAMKMENILKAAADGTVKHVKVNKGKSVEKNEVLITFS